MQTRIYSIYDMKAEAFNPPFTVTTHGIAIRQFEDHCKQSESVIAKHPEDYKLVHIGDIDLITGEITPTKPTNLALATDFFKES